MKKFVIKKNNHISYPLIKFGLVYDKHIMFRVKFTDSCLYKINDIDGEDLNKLYGFSDGSYHMTNSARIGWRCLNGEDIELHAFIHKKGIKEYKYITSVKPNEQILINMFVIYENDEYMIDITDSEFKMSSVRMKRGTGNKFKLDYLLFPYFGGNHTSPNNMEIFIERHI